MIDRIKNYFTGHDRSVKIKKNILASFLIKGGSIFIGFMMVPLCLDYLDKTRYGIWLTVSSILIWFTFFEIGLGSGLRNKLAEALAIKDYNKAKIYVSTTYVIISIFALLLTIIYFFVNAFIDWTKVFNTDPSLYKELTLLVNVVFSFFFLRFVLKLISTILYADQRPALANAIGPIGNLFSIIVIYILTKTTEGSLVYLGLVLSIAPVLVMFIFSFLLFSGRYKYMSPSIKYFRYEYASSLFNIGIKFFVVQVSGLVLYHSTNIIISQFFGPAEVTPYNIAYKLFSVINMVFGIVVMPYWSAYTEAWKVKDIKWIKKSVRKLLKFWSFLVLLGIIILIFSDKIYKFWVGDRVEIHFILSLYLFIYFSLFTFGGIFNMFINGVGKIKLQLYMAMTSAIIFYPLSFYFVKKLDMGIEGLALAIIVTNIYGPFVAPIHFYKIINFKAKGIWNK